MKLKLTFLTLIITVLFGGNQMSSAIENAKIYSFEVKNIQGETESLSKYQGKALLIVNTASKCGFTPQYQPLQELYEKYKDKGFVVLGFPANNFMHQEPGTDEEIKQFCDLRFKIKFPLYSKISVKGKDIHPLYEYLTEESGFNGPITWNFNKFLVSPTGKVVARYDSKTDPLSKELVEKLESVLPNG
jgi:glutathione peroxidase-family protein